MPFRPRSTRNKGRHHHQERHRIEHLAWLRAAVMGANDGILSIGALLVGLAGASLGHKELLISGLAGTIAGAGSMAMGEYVSVSAERDTFEAEHQLEAHEILTDPEGETEELRAIWQKRGLSSELAHQVAEALMEHDALGAHMRDELGYAEMTRPQPLLAAVSSFVSFWLGALVPLLATALAASSGRGPVTAGATLVGLVALGSLAAWLAGSSVARGALRVSAGGVLALALSYGAGHLFGTGFG